MDLSQATYRISEHDFVKASFLNDKPSHRHFAVYGTLIILLTVIYISDFYEMGELALGVLAGIVLST